MLGIDLAEIGDKEGALGVGVGVRVGSEDAVAQMDVRVAVVQGRQLGKQGLIRSLNFIGTSQDIVCKWTSNNRRIFCGAEDMDE